MGLLALYLLSKSSLSSILATVYEEAKLIKSIPLNLPNHLELNSGDKIALTRVLLVNNEGDVSVGHPCLANAKVEATILGHINSRKVTVYKMRPKKKTRKKQGYRSNLTRVMINSIQFDGSTIQ